MKKLLQLLAMILLGLPGVCTQTTDYTWSSCGYTDADGNNHYPSSFSAANGSTTGIPISFSQSQDFVSTTFPVRGTVILKTIQFAKRGSGDSNLMSVELQDSQSRTIASSTAADGDAKISFAAGSDMTIYHTLSGNPTSPVTKASWLLMFSNVKVDVAQTYKLIITTDNNTSSWVGYSSVGPSSSAHIPAMIVTGETETCEKTFKVSNLPYAASREISNASYNYLTFKFSDVQFAHNKILPEYLMLTQLAFANRSNNGDTQENLQIYDTTTTENTPIGVAAFKSVGTQTITDSVSRTFRSYFLADSVKIQKDRIYRVKAKDSANTYIGFTVFQPNDAETAIAETAIDVSNSTTEPTGYSPILELTATALCPVYEYALSNDETWAPPAAAVVKLTVDEENTFELADATDLVSLIVQGEGKVSLSGSRLTTYDTSISTDTDVSGISSDLGDVTINEGATLTIGANTSYDSLVNDGTLSLSSGVTLTLNAGEEGNVTVQSGTTLHLLLNELQLIEGYEGTGIAKAEGGTLRYGTLVNGEFVEITAAEGSYEGNSFKPAALVWAGGRDGTWDMASNWSPAQTPDNKNVEFLDLKDGETILDNQNAVVGLGANVSPKSILVENTAGKTAYTIGSDTYAIQGNVILVKRGTGSLTIAGPNANDATTRISEVVQEGGTIKIGNNYALLMEQTMANAPVGTRLTIKGGTFNMNEAFAYNDSALGYLTESVVTLGGSEVAACITNGNIVSYSNTSNLQRDLIHYVGTYGADLKSPAAEFAANVKGTYTHDSQVRNIIVEQGAGSTEGDAKYVGYDLNMTGLLDRFHQSNGTLRDANLVVVKKGLGVLKISNENNIPTLRIEEGTVLVGHEAALSASTVIAAGATLDLNGFSPESGVSFTGSGILTNSSETAVKIPTSALVNFAGTITGNLNPPTQLTWMPFGDSITEGESTDVSYRHALWTQLTNAGYEIQSVGLRNVTKNGTGTTEKWSYHNAWYGATVMPIRSVSNNHGSSTSLFYNLDTCLEAGGYPDIITVLIGTNDAANPNERDNLNKSGATDAQTAEFLQDRFDEWVMFIDRLATLRPHSQIFVSTPPKLKTDNSNINTYAEKIRDAAGFGGDRQVKEPFASHSNLHFVDMHGMKPTGDADSLSTLGDADYINDGTHPNASGCEKIATVWKNAIVSKIGTRGELKGTDNALLPVEVFNPSVTTVQVRFNKQLKASQADATATLVGVSDVALSQPTLDDACRTLTFTASKELPFHTDLTITVQNVVAEDESTTGNVGASKMFRAYGSGASANIPASFRGDFKHRKTLSIVDNPDYTTGVPYSDGADAQTPISYVGRVAYYLELQREGKPAQFVWVAMNAFDSDEAKLGVPTTDTRNHQVEVTGLEVFANRANISNTTERVSGIVEFTPYGYSATDDDFTSVRDLFDQTSSGIARYGWRDTLNTSGDLRGCMQVARIINNGTASSPLWAGAQMIFAFNDFYGESNLMDLGIGSYSTTWDTAAAAVAPTYDWTDITEKGNAGVQASAYKIKKLEIWVEEEPIATWTGVVDSSWDVAGNWTPAEVPSKTDTLAVKLNESATGHPLTLAEGSYNTTFTGNGKLKIAENATVTLAGASAHTGGVEIGSGATLTLGDAGALGTGAITGTSTSKLVCPAGYPSGINGLTDAAWCGTLVLSDVTFSNNESIEVLGNANSSIELKGTSSGFFAWQINGTEPADKIITCPAAIILNGTLALSCGHNAHRFVFAKSLTGNGTFSLDENTDRHYTVQFADVSKFVGELKLLTHRHSFCIGEMPTSEITAGHMLITGNAIIPDGKTWQANKGVDIASTGRIQGSGSISAAGANAVGLSFQTGATLVVGATPLTVKTAQTSASVTGTLNVVFDTPPTSNKPKVLNTSTAPTISAGATVTAPGWTLHEATADGLYLRRKGFMLMIK